MIISDKNRIDEMFQKNLTLLPPWLMETVLNIDTNELWDKVTISYNEEGYPICCYNDNGKSFKINSNNPIQEAEIWCDNISLKGANSIFLYGTGFGYSIHKVFEKKEPHAFVVIFEQNIYLFTAMLYYFDLEPILKSEKVVFLVGDIPHFAKAFEALFYSIIFASCTYPVVLFTQAAQRNFKPQYLSIHEYVFSQLSLIVFYVGNDHLDNLIGMNNLILNIKEIVENPYISSLKDKYKDVPAFIIANGPSLDKNIHELNNIENKGLIISTESAIIPLLKNKIKPDILTIIERTKYTYIYHFENIDYPDDISLLCLGLVDNKVFPSFPGPRIPIFRFQESINEWINKYLGDGSSINAGANVSHLAFELAVYLGANPIVFVGQDYAYGPEGLTHSQYAVYSEDKGKKAREVLKSKPVVYVEGNEEPIVPSNRLWTDFRLGLEKKISNYPDKTIINATEGGAKISGTKYEKLSNVIEKYCKDTIPYKVNEIIINEKNKIDKDNRIKGLEEFIKSIESYTQKFHKSSIETAQGKIKCREMMNLSKRDDYLKYRSILEEAYKDNILFYQKCINDDLYRCFSQQTIFSYYYLMNNLGFIDTQEKITQIFEIQYGFFNHLNLIYQSLSVYLEDVSKYLYSVLNQLRS